MKAYVSTDEDVETKGHGDGDDRLEPETGSSTVRGLRGYVRKRPITMLGVAFGGGLLAAAMLGSRRSDVSESANGRHGSPRPRRGHDFMENVKGAVLGAASIQALAFLGDVLEGLQERYAAPEGTNDRTKSRART